MTVCKPNSYNLEAIDIKQVTGLAGFKTQKGFFWFWFLSHFRIPCINLTWKLSSKKTANFANIFFPEKSIWSMNGNQGLTECYLL